jgi:hypothetical protein
MGATSVCPGTHHCYDVQEGVCDKHGFQVANDTSKQIWPVGYGTLANMQTFHRGAQHSQKYGPTRTTLIIHNKHTPHSFRVIFCNNRKVTKMCESLVPYNKEKKKTAKMLTLTGLSSLEMVTGMMTASDTQIIMA